MNRGFVVFAVLFLAISCKEEDVPDVVIIDETPPIVTTYPNSFSEIQSAFKSHSIIELDEEKTYRFTNTILINSGENIIINGNNATLIADSTLTLFKFSGKSNNIEIRNVNIVSDKFPPKSKGSIFNFLGNDRDSIRQVVLENISVSVNFGAKNITQANVITLKSCVDVKIMDCKFSVGSIASYTNHNNQKNGIVMDRCSRVTINNTIIENVKGTAILGTSSSYCLINNNEILNSGRNGIMFGGAHNEGSIDHNLFSGNHIKHVATGNGVFIAGRSAEDQSSKNIARYNTIKENLIEDAFDAGIASGSGSYYTVIESNEIYNAGNKSILVADNRSFSIVNNKCVLDVPNEAFELDYANIMVMAQVPTDTTDDETSIIKDNNISGTYPVGIKIKGAKKVRIESNILLEMPFLKYENAIPFSRAISLESSEAIEVNANEVLSSDVGIFLTKQNTDVKITQNKINGDSAISYGLFLSVGPHTGLNIFGNQFQDQIEIPIFLDNTVSVIGSSCFDNTWINNSDIYFMSMEDFISNSFALFQRKSFTFPERYSYIKIPDWKEGYIYKVAIDNFTESCTFIIEPNSQLTTINQTTLIGTTPDKRYIIEQVEPGVFGIKLNRVITQPLIKTFSLISTPI